MNIAIDARFYGGEHTGLGRYTTNVLKYLPKHMPGVKLQILLRDKYYDAFPGGKNIVKIHAEIPHYSFMEQFELPLLLKSIGADVLYTFHFNIPIFSGIPTVVTIHDLIKSNFTGRDTTTRAPWLYGLKRSGYDIAMRRAATQAADIIVPTNTVKNQVLASYPTVRPEHIHVIPEAPDEIFRRSQPASPAGRSTTYDLRSSINLPSKFILFVGNVYPHKNLSVLLSALGKMPDQQLVIIAKKSPFLTRLLTGRDTSRITLIENATDDELVSIYKHASVLVTPSLMEGYGLVGLEALMAGTPVVAADIPVYHEVYGDNVTYFDPTSSANLVSAVRSTSHTMKPLIFARTWDKVARDIAEVLHASSARVRSTQ